jgi:hypothetical protein
LVALIDLLQRARRCHCGTSSRRCYARKQPLLCHSFAASGINTLFVDASAEPDDADELDAWMPGEPIGIGQIERPSAAHSIDVLRIRAAANPRGVQQSQPAQENAA